MCGIFGCTPNNLTTSDIAEIKATLKDRGPDGQGEYDDQKVVLVHTRLSIVDLQHGAQPFYNEDQSLVCVANGEIYNFSQLKAQLIQCGHRFQTDNDCEVLLHMYEEKGIDGFKELEGIYAFAIYEKNQRLIIGRDPIGVKPLYYWHQNNQLVFGSLIKTLMAHPDVKTSLNSSALLQYEVFGYWMDYQTLFTNIFEVKPGHVVEFLFDSTINERKFFDLFVEQQMFLMSKEEAIDYLTELLEESFSMNLQGDVSMGTLLSGGLDSTILYCSLVKRGQMPALTVGNPESPDWQTAERITNYFDKPHHFYNVDPDKYLRDLPEIVAASESFLKGAAIYYSALLAKNRFKVLLCGEGADELFGGYSIYATPLDFLKKVDYKVKLVRRRDLDKDTLYSIEDKLMSYRSMMNPKLLTEYLLKEWGQYQLNVKHLNLIDHLSMKHGVEIRVPYLSTKLVQFANSLPLHYKVGRELKYLLRQAGAKICPPDLYSEVNSRSKISFPHSILHYVEPKIEQMVETKLSTDYILKHPYADIFIHPSKNRIFSFDLFYHIFFNKKGSVSGNEVEEVLQGNIY